MTKTDEMNGLGDLVAKAIAAVGIKPSGDCGCKQRQEYLNRLLSFKRRLEQRERPPQPHVEGVKTKVGLGDWS